MGQSGVSDTAIQCLPPRPKETSHHHPAPATENIPPQLFFIDANWACNSDDTIDDESAGMCDLFLFRRIGVVYGCNKRVICVLFGRCVP
mmetsp:Transcript_16105/g.30431  ORF Transcript_16105/g.30431 Transcript_16105/m.30431 type:complete len:89 (+) Transcript_16105:128-394(+)